MNLAAKAAIGAELLDVHDPKWFTKIDLELLDMSSMTKCIMGQLFGSYTSEDATRFMHSAPYHMHSDFGVDLPGRLIAPENWALLEIAWIAEINKRRELTSV